MKAISFKALQQMAKEFDEITEDGDRTFKSTMDFYLYVVDNHEAVEKEISKNS